MNYELAGSAADAGASGEDFVETIGEGVNPVVGYAADAEKEYAGDADGESPAGGAVYTESGEWLVVGRDIHGLDDKQIVVEGDDGIDKGYQYEPVAHATHGLEGCHEDEELREEACEGRDACQGEEAERHKEGEARVGLIEPGVVVDANLACVLFNRGEHGEGAEVGGKINEEVENQGGHALCGAVHDAEHEVAGLRNGGEGHESLEVLLADGEEVGHGNGGNDNPEAGPVPFCDELAEDLLQHGEEHEGCGALGNHAEITGNDGGSALIGVGRPEVEGHEGNLKAHAGDEEREAEDGEELGVYSPVGASEDAVDFIKIERAGGTIDEADAVEQQGAGEEGEEDELRAGFCTFVAFLVKSHEGCHGDGGEFEADEEHEEVAAGYHEIHTEECEEHELIELSLLYPVLFAAEPLVAHEEDNDDTDVEDGLHDGGHRRGLIHAAEGFRYAGAAGACSKYRVNREEDEGQGALHAAYAEGFFATTCLGTIVALLRIPAKEEVCKEYETDDSEEAELLGHI